MNTFSFPTSSLASRSKASDIRAHVITALDTNKTSCIQLDFSGVDSVSASYADELFGVLSLVYGVDALTKRVLIKNASKDIILAIAKAIHERELSKREMSTEAPEAGLAYC